MDQSAAHLNVLFLCTGNSARSILAEYLLNHLSQGKFYAYSAGSQPTGRVNPFALEVLQATGINLASARSKHWDEFSQPNAPHMDIIITVCDNAAGETCPIWPGHPITAHWGHSDPAAVSGSDADKRAAFLQVMQDLTRQIQQLLQLPISQLSAEALQTAVRQIGQPAASTR